MSSTILHVTPYYAPAWAYGGVPRAVYEIAHQQVKKGDKVTVLTTDAYDAKERVQVSAEVIDGIHIIRVKNISNRLIWQHHFSSMLSLPKSIDFSVFDVVHLHEARTILNYLVLKQLRASSVVIFSPWGTLPYNEHQIFLKKVFDFFLLPLLRQRVDVATGQTSHELQVLKEFGVGRKKIILPLGIDLHNFRKLPNRRQFRKKLGVKQKTKLYLFLGRYAQAKGLELLFRAFVQFSKSARKKGQEVCLVCVGRDDGYLSRMNELIQELRSKNILIHGPLYDADRFQAYTAADVFVFTPIVFEETSTACLEALGCGTPVITTRQAEVPFLSVKNGVWHIPAQQQSVVAALQKTLTQKKVLTPHTGGQLVARYFSWQMIVADLEKLYGKTKKQNAHQKKKHLRNTVRR